MDERPWKGGVRSSAERGFAVRRPGPGANTKTDGRTHMGGDGHPRLPLFVAVAVQPTQESSQPPGHASQRGLRTHSRQAKLGERGEEEGKRVS